MRRSADDRLPWEPLEAALRRRFDEPLDSPLAKAIGISRSSLHRYQEDGVTWAVADRLCVEALGVHPVVIFGAAWVAHDDLDDAQEGAAA